MQSPEEKEAIIALRRIWLRDYGPSQEEIDEMCDIDECPGTLEEEVENIYAIQRLRDFDITGMLEEVRKKQLAITTRLNLPVGTFVCLGCEKQVLSDEHGNFYCDCHDERPNT